MNFEIPDAIKQYFEFVPPSALAFLIAFLLTPWIGRFAQRFGFADVPVVTRFNKGQPNNKQHVEGIARLGGLAVITAFFATLLAYNHFPAESYGILIGMAIITALGIADDKRNLSGRTQILVQLIAAIIVVVSGVTIKDIQIAGQFIDLSAYTTHFNLFGLSYDFIFPADFLTIFWILIVMNSLAWVCGIDALGESITFIASITFAALSVKFGNPAYAFMFFVYAGSMMGFIPYNLPKAKIIGGSVGHLNYGFFLSIMAIVSGTKLPSAVLILIMPLIDMLWVLWGRFRANRGNSIFHLLSVSGRTHLHHRIMDLGFNVKETLYIELMIFSCFSIIAFYLGGFSFDFVVLATGIVMVLIIFTALGMMYKSGWVKQEKKTKTAPPKRHRPVEKEQTPEEKYAY